MVKKISVTVKGQEFSSLKAAADRFGVRLETAARRLRAGRTPEQAFGLTEIIVDHSWPESRLKPLKTSAGTFRTLKNAEAQFGVRWATIQRRLAIGWTPDQAVGLTRPPLRKPKEGIPIRCAGEEFPTIRAMADRYRKGRIMVYKRLRAGWTAEQAVGLEPPPPRFRNQVGGARDQVWKRVEIVGDKPYPSAQQGQFKVYVIRNKRNGHEYVGITISPLADRLRGHKALARKGVKTELYNAMRRYGSNNFTIELIRNDARSFAELQRQEIKEIEKRETIERGYNVSPGGQVGTPEEILIAGVRYPSRSAAAEHFGISVSAFNLRISRLGWTPEEAAGIAHRPKFSRRKVTVAGNEFPSLRAAARHLRVDYKLTHDRLVSKGWALDQALGVAPAPDTTKYRGMAVRAFGQSFKSLNECAAHFGIKPETLRRRVRRLNQDIEYAIRELERHPKPGGKGRPNQKAVKVASKTND